MKVFISYSHKDEYYLKKLDTAFAQMRRQRLIQDWTDNQIEPGCDFNQGINSELLSSKLFIALISPDYIASNYCYEKEFEKAQELAKIQRLKIIPIICRPCDWKNTPFSDLQALPKGDKAISEWHNEDSAINNITEILRATIQKPLKQEFRVPKVEYRQKEANTLLPNKEKKFKPIWLIGAFAILILIAFLFFQNSSSQNNATTKTIDTTGKNSAIYPVPKLDSGNKPDNNKEVPNTAKKQEGNGEYNSRSETIDPGKNIEKSYFNEKKFSNDSLAETTSAETKLPSYSLKHNGGSKIKYYATPVINEYPVGYLDYSTQLTTVELSPETNYQVIKFSFKDPHSSSTVIYGWIDINYLQKK